MRAGRTASIALAMGRTALIVKFIGTREAAGEGPLAQTSEVCRAGLLCGPSCPLAHLAWPGPRLAHLSARPPSTDAKGSTVPKTSDVANLTSLICNNQRAAARQLYQAIKSGGTQAQVAVYALFNSNCTDTSAASDTCEGSVEAPAAAPVCCGVWQVEHCMGLPNSSVPS